MLHALSVTWENNPLASHCRAYYEWYRECESRFLPSALQRVENAVRYFTFALESVFTHFYVIIDYYCIRISDPLRNSNYTRWMETCVNCETPRGLDMADVLQPLESNETFFRHCSIVFRLFECWCMSEVRKLTNKHYVRSENDSVYPETCIRRRISRSDSRNESR